MLREFGVDGSTTFFDTTTADHHHFYIEGRGRKPANPYETPFDDAKMATVPDGYEIARVDLVIRLRAKR